MTRAAIIGGAMVALLTLIVGVFFFGAHTGKQSRDLDAARDHIETRERIDNADTDFAGDDDVIDRLRDLAR